jgi:hypothetical protein
VISSYTRFHIALVVVATAAGCVDVAPDEELGETSSDLQVTSWSPKLAIGGASSFGATPATVDGTTVIARNALYWTERTATGWTPWTPTTNQFTNLRPSLAGFNHQIFALRTGTQHRVYMTQFDPSTATWSEGALLPYLSYQMPALVVFQNKLWIIGNSPDTYQMWSATMGLDGELTQAQFIDGKYTVQRPSAAVYANRLYVAHQQASGDAIIYARFDGVTWTANQFIFAGVGGSAITGLEPQLAAVNGFLHIVYRNPAGSAEVKWSYFDTCSWTPEVSIGSLTTAEGYGLAQGGPGLVLTTHLRTDSPIYVSEFTAPPAPLLPPSCSVVGP